MHATCSSKMLVSKQITLSNKGPLFASRTSHVLSSAPSHFGYRSIVPGWSCQSWALGLTRVCQAAQWASSVSGTPTLACCSSVPASSSSREGERKGLEMKQSSRWVQSWQSRRRDKNLHSNHWPDTMHASIHRQRTDKIRYRDRLPKCLRSCCWWWKDFMVLLVCLIYRATATTKKPACFCWNYFYCSVFQDLSCCVCVCVFFFLNRFTVHISSWGGIYISESEKWQPFFFVCFILKTILRIESLWSP